MIRHNYKRPRSDASISFLWKIEETFRIMKTTLEVRPIYHWTERRIRGHFVMCFISFLMMRTLQLLLKEEGFTIEKIREALRSLTVTKISINGQVVYLKNKCSPFASAILRKLKIKPLDNITKEEELTI